MTNLQAAVGLAQTEKAGEYVGMRRKNHALYARFLSGVEGISLQPEMPYAKNVYWMNAVAIDKNIIRIGRDEIRTRLEDKGIETRLLFNGMNRQPALKDYGCDCGARYPVSDMLADNGFYLPSGSGLKEEEISFICDELKSALIKYGR